MDFAYILLFAQENKAKIYSEKVVELFCVIKYLNKTLQLDIHYVLKKLIRLHFRDDENKTKELLTMITQAVHPEVLENMNTLQKMARKIEEKDNLLLEKDKVISEQDKELSEKDNVISKQDKEILRLKNQLKEKET